MPCGVVDTVLGVLGVEGGAFIGQLVVVVASLAGGKDAEDPWRGKE